MKLHAFRHIRVDGFLSQKLIDFAVPGLQVEDFRFRLFEIIFPFPLTCLFLFLLFPVQFSRRFRFCRFGLRKLRVLRLRRQNIMLFQIIIVIADIID